MSLVSLLAPVLVAGVLGADVASPMAPQAAITAVNDVTLVVPGQQARPGQELLIDKGRIRKIQPASDHSGPYSGMYVIPGLIDMHTHWPTFGLANEDAMYAFLHLSHGVTTVRVLGHTADDTTTPVVQALASGEYAGPRITRCGAFVDGNPPAWKGARVVETPEQAERVVADLYEAGSSCIKVYDKLSLEVLNAVRVAAKARGLPVIGHVPEGLDVEQARLDDYQHMRGFPPLPPGTFPRYPLFLSQWELVDAAWQRQLIALLKAQGSAVTPTLVTIDRLLASFNYADMINDAAYRLVPPYYTDALWSIDNGINAARFLDDEQRAMVKRAYPQMAAMVLALQQAGVPIHAGTDTGAPGVVPGAGLHRELQLLNSAGLSPEEALMAATTNAARFLGDDYQPLLEEGALADFVILRRDPRQGLDALDTIVAVVKNGELYTRETLDAQAGRYRESFDTIAHRYIIPKLVSSKVNKALKEMIPADH